MKTNRTEVLKAVHTKWTHRQNINPRASWSHKQAMPHYLHSDPFTNIHVYLEHTDQHINSCMTRNRHIHKPHTSHTIFVYHMTFTYIQCIQTSTIYTYHTHITPYICMHTHTYSTPMHTHTSHRYLIHTTHSNAYTQTDAPIHTHTCSTHFQIIYHITYTHYTFIHTYI